MARPVSVVVRCLTTDLSYTHCWVADSRCKRVSHPTQHIISYYQWRVFAAINCTVLTTNSIQPTEITHTNAKKLNASVNLKKRAVFRCKNFHKVIIRYVSSFYTNTKSYFRVTRGRRVWTTCQRLLRSSARPEVESSTFCHYTTGQVRPWLRVCQLTTISNKS